VQPKGTECRQIEELTMSRKTRRWKKRRRKRFNRILSLLEASNLDPKRRNRKTRLRQLWKLVRADVSLMYRW